MKIFKKLRRKKSTSSLTKTEDKINDVVLTPTSESNVEDNNIAADFDESTSNNKNFNGISSRDHESGILSSHGDDILPREVMQSQQSGSSLEEVMSDSVRNVNESSLSRSPEYNVNDVETEAVIKVQTNYRRYLVIKQLEKEGKVTESKFNKERSSHSCDNDTDGEDLSSLSRFCGLGLLFNGALGGDSRASNLKENWGCADKTQLQMAQDEINGKFMTSSVNNEEAVN